jgi:hypothetical protein
LRHALLHRAETSEWADAWRLAADMSFLDARCRELGAHEAEADVARMAERCRASGDHVLRKRFADLARALGRESHWLRSAPDATAALIWNQLRQSGWSTADLEQQLRLPPGAGFLRLRHVAMRDSHAPERELLGHDAKVNACAVTPDGRRVVSASDDRTLKVWDLESRSCLFTHRGHAEYRAVAVTANAIIAGDVTSAVWFLDWPEPSPGPGAPRGSLPPVRMSGVSAHRTASSTGREPDAQTNPGEFARSGNSGHLDAVFRARPRYTSRRSRDHHDADRRSSRPHRM